MPSDVLGDDGVSAQFTQNDFMSWEMLEYLVELIHGVNDETDVTILTVDIYHHDLVSPFR
jgi:hypothetical protein